MSVIVMGSAPIAGLLLAAGGSSRLGRPKQLVRIDGETLIRRSAASLIKAGAEPVIIVLGAEIDACKAELAGLPVMIRINENWREGMSTSIRCGIEAIRELGGSTGVLISLCDQLHVTATELRRLLTTSHEMPGRIIAAEYSGTLGVPAVFPSSYFDQLEEITGDKGAKEIIRNEIDSVVAVTIQAAEFDLDSEQDVPGQNRER
jgi:molybdenum cofactor cytidylyltransferase